MVKEGNGLEASDNYIKLYLSKVWQPALAASLARSIVFSHPREPCVQDGKNVKGTKQKTKPQKQTQGAPCTELYFSSKPCSQQFPSIDPLWCRPDL